MNKRAISYKSEDKSSFTKYIFGFTFNTIGVRGEESKDNHADVYYGNNPSSTDARLIIRQNKEDILWQELLTGQIATRDIDRIVPFDLVNAIGFFLTDKGNRALPKESYDSHRRLIFNRSYQYRQDIAGLPVVNLYIEFLKALFEREFSVPYFPLWPNQKKCAVGLSHDADLPEKYAILSTPFFNKNTNFKGNFLTILKKVNAARKRLLDRNPDDFWLFEQIMNTEEKYGFKSTFFFASMNQHGEWGSQNDVIYDINRPKFRKIFEEIVGRGFEIGLHASYNAYKNLNYFLTEKNRLSTISGCEVKGVRHHCWHMGSNIDHTLELHEKTGFTYDASLAFNEAMGFRRNIALPYYPWIEVSQKQLKVIQLPVFCMDGSLFYHPEESKDAVERVKSCIGVIKQYRGMGVIDWHVRTSYPKNKEYRDWGEAYVEIIEYLSTDPEIWVTHLSEIASWIKRREDMLS